MPDCIFCRIAAGEIPARIVLRNDHVIAFHDLAPQAPAHVLVIPVAHYDSAAAASGDAGAHVMGEMMRMGNLVAAELGLSQGYRFVVNTGADGGQSVGHLHLHVLGGRQMRWPPG